MVGPGENAAGARKRRWHKPMRRTVTPVLSSRMSLPCRSAVAQFSIAKGLTRSEALERLVWLGVHASGETNISVASRLIACAASLLEQEKRNG